MPGLPAGGLCARRPHGILRDGTGPDMVRRDGTGQDGTGQERTEP